MTPEDLAAIRQRAHERARLATNPIPDPVQLRAAHVLGADDVPALLAELDRLTARLDESHKVWFDAAQRIAAAENDRDQVNRMLLVVNAALRLVHFWNNVSFPDTPIDHARPLQAAVAAYRTAISPTLPVVAPFGCDDCSVEPGERHRYPACPGVTRLGLYRPATPTVEPTATPPTWLWDQRIPNQALTTVIGAEGSGKSLFVTWLAARITRGELPGQFLGKPRNVVWVSGEDEWGTTIVPRLEGAGADLNRVFLISGAPTDEHLIDVCGRDDKRVLLVVDPAMALDPRIEYGIIRVLNGLRRVAREANVAVVTTYLGNSDAIMNVSASVLACRPHPDPWRRLVHLKSTLGRPQPDFLYRIGETTVDNDEGIHAARLAFPEPEPTEPPTDLSKQWMRVATLTNERDVARAEASRYRIELEASQAQVRDLADLLDRARTERDQARIDCDHVRRGYDEFQKMAAAEADFQSDEIDRLRRSRNKWRRRARKSQKARVLLTDNLLAADNTVAALRAGNATLQTRIAAVKDEWATYRGALQDLQSAHIQSAQYEGAARPVLDLAVELATRSEKSDAPRTPLLEALIAAVRLYAKQGPFRMASDPGAPTNGLPSPIANVLEAAVAWYDIDPLPACPIPQEEALVRAVRTWLTPPDDDLAELDTPEADIDHALATGTPVQVVGGQTQPHRSLNDIYRTGTPESDALVQATRGMASLRARSCPSCHSIGDPRDNCRDSWHPENVRCSQCGQLWTEPACGPTHAALAAERVAGSRNATTGFPLLPIQPIPTPVAERRVNYPTIAGPADADAYLAGLLNPEAPIPVPVDRVDPDGAADDDWTNPEGTP